MKFLIITALSLSSAISYAKSSQTLTLKQLTCALNVLSPDMITPQKIEMRQSDLGIAGTALFAGLKNNDETYSAMARASLVPNANLIVVYVELNQTNMQTGSDNRISGQIVINKETRVGTIQQDASDVPNKLFSNISVTCEMTH